MFFNNYICLRSQFKLVSQLILYSARGGIIIIISALQFFYKQPVYKQPVLDRYNNKQLSGLKILNINNHLKIEIKNGKKIKIEENNFIQKRAWLELYFFFLAPKPFFPPNSSFFHFLHAFGGTKKQFQVFYFQSIRVLET